LVPTGAYAQSDIWDWLGELSGPGPFHASVRSIHSRAFCTVHDGGKVHIDWWCGNDTDPNIRSVVAAEVAWPDSDSNVRFSDVSTAVEPQNTKPVRATRVVVNYYYRFHPMVDLGVGGGALVFSGDDFTNQVHPVLSPLNLVFTPFALVKDDKGNPARLGRVIRFKFSERYILGDIRAQDFNSLKSGYFKSGEWNPNFSVSFDLWPIIDQRHRR
jgi:hypothetical protein